MSGNEIKLFLRGKGITQEMVAEKLKISRQTVNAYYKQAEAPDDFVKSVKIFWGYAPQDAGQTKQNPPQGQVSEQLATLPMSSLDKLIQANADQSAAVKDIAAANMELVLMLKGEKGNATAHAEDRNLEREIANLDRLLAGTIKLLADQKKTSFEEMEAKAHIAGGEILQSYKTGTQSAKDKSYS